jgi:hypothetical protein
MPFIVENFQGQGRAQNEKLKDFIGYFRSIQFNMSKMRNSRTSLAISVVYSLICQNEKLKDFIGYFRSIQFNMSKSRNSRTSLAISVVYSLICQKVELLCSKKFF